MKFKELLLLRRKAMTDLDNLIKSRDVTFPMKVHIVKAIVFPIVMYRYESWAIKKVNTKEMMLSNCGAEEDS